MAVVGLLSGVNYLKLPLTKLIVPIRQSLNKDFLKKDNRKPGEKLVA